MLILLGAGALLVRFLFSPTSALFLKKFKKNSDF
jgi:hypothetical protein